MKYSRQQQVVFAALVLVQLVVCYCSSTVAESDEIAEIYEKIFSHKSDAVYKPEETYRMLNRLLELLDDDDNNNELGAENEERLRKVSELLYFAPRSFNCDMADEDWDDREGYYVMHRYSGTQTVADYLDDFVDRIVEKCGPTFTVRVRKAMDDIKRTVKDHKMVFKFKDLAAERFLQTLQSQDFSGPMFKFVEQQIGRRPKSREEFVKYYNRTVLRACEAIGYHWQIVKHFSSLMSPSQLGKLDATVQDWYKVVNICGRVTPRTPNRVYNRVVGPEA